MKKNNFFFLILSIVILFASCTQDCTEIKFADGISTLNGKLYTGDCESRYINNQVKSIQHYADGKDEGAWIFYYLDGKVQTKAFFKAGIRVGKWEYFHENGQLWKTQTYDALGNKIGVWETFDEDGKLIKETSF